MHQFATRLCYQQYRWSLTNRYVLSRILELWHCRLRLCCKLVSFTVYNLILLHTAFAAAWNQRALLLYGDLSVDNCTASHQECETVWNTDVRHLYYYYLITGTLTEDRLQNLCRFDCRVVSENECTTENRHCLKRELLTTIISPMLWLHRLDIIVDSLLQEPWLSQKCDMIYSSWLHAFRRFRLC